MILSSGAILAGGKNSRMHRRNKAFLPIRESTILQRTVNIFKEIFAEIIIVTNSPAEYRAFEKECRIVCDKIKNAGPLAGIHAALSQAKEGSVFFVACDMPFLHKGLILRQLRYFAENDCAVLVPRIGVKIEPLHALYKTSLKQAIGACLETSSDFSLRSFLQKVNLRYLDLEDTGFTRKIFMNINTEKEWEEIFLRP